MNAQVKIEKLEKPDEITYDTDFMCEVIVKDLGTDRTVPIVESLLPALKTVTEVIHYRKREPILYRTIIKSRFLSIDVKNGLSSGYGGEGANGLYRVLQTIGVSEGLAKVVFDNEYENAVISIKLEGES